MWIQACWLNRSRGISVAALVLFAMLALPWSAGFAAPAGPAANAGLPQHVAVGATVRLDGSASTSSTGAPLTYAWSLVSVPDGSSAALSNPAAVNPTFVADLAGTYVAQLQASDGSSNSSAQVTISTQDVPPIADAGKNQLVTTGSVVHLDASASADPDGDSLTLQWNFVSTPAGSRTSMSNPAAIAPTFVADLAGTYVAQVTVTDSHGNNASATVTIGTQDAPPIVKAGRAQSVSVGATVQLDGSASFDPGGGALSYSWSLLSQPSGSSASLSSTSIANPTFVADVAGAYVAQLAVTDGHGSVALATVEVTTDTIPPTADAGSAQSVAVGGSVQLDGRNSAATNGAPLQYAWSLLAKPKGSAANLAGGGTSSTTSFTADQPGQYLVQLQVFDGVLTSAPSTVLIMAAASGPNWVISPSPVNFGNQAIGVTSGPLGVTLTNLGAVPVQITSFLVAGINASEFSLRGLNSVTLAPNNAFIFSVLFTPQAAGTGSASLIVYDSSGGAPHVVSLTGFGGTFSAACVPSPTTLSFPDQTVNTTSATRTITVTNTGNAALQITGLTLAGANAADFGFAPGFNLPSLAAPISVAANNGSTVIPIVFKPGANGTRLATLSISSNAPTSPVTVQVSGNGVTGQLSAIAVTPASIAFPDQAVGSASAALPVTVTNSGTTAVQVTAWRFEGNNATEFSTTAAPSFNVPANGGTAIIPVIFTPGAAGLRSGMLIVTDSSGGGPHTVNLSGNGTVAGPGTSVSPTLLDFQNQALNTTTTMPVTVANVGGTTASVTSLLLAGINASDFGINGQRSFTLAAGGRGTINVQFTPQALATRTASLIVYDDTPSSPHVVTLTGVGGTSAPKVQLSTTLINFPDQAVGVPSIPMSVNVTNTGNATLLITGVTIGGTNPADFTLPITFTPPTPASPISVPPNGVAGIPVSFKPTTSGARAGTLFVADNATGSPHTVALSGNGIGQQSGVTVTPGAIAFPDQAVGSGSAAVPVTVTNNTSAAIQVTSLRFSGANVGDFSTTVAAPINVGASGGTAIIPVIFTPSAAGTRVAVLTVTDSSGGSTHTVNVSGNGIVAPPGMSISPNPLAFTDQGVNTTAMLPLTVTNTGGTTANVTSLLMAGINATDFAINGPRSFTVAPGSRGTINVQFTPQAQGARTASLIVYDDTPGSPHVVTISGKGVVPAPAFAANPSPLTFADQAVGSSATLQLTVSNSGTAPLQITSLTFTSGNPGDFAFPVSFTPPSQAAPLTVANNGGTTTFPVIFKPTASGNRTTSLAFTDNATGSPHSVTLSGRGTAPAFFATPIPLVFANQNVGTSGSPVVLTVTNSGTGTLQITGIGIGGTNAGDFAFGPNFTAPTANSPIQLAPSANTPVPIVFTPVSQGSRTATLTLTDNASDSQQTVALAATGIGPNPVLNPVSIAFGPQLLNQASAATPFSITNSGNAALQITGIAITGTNGGDFSFASGFTPPTPASPLTVAANGTVNIGVIFTPGATGSRSAAVTITDNAPLSPRSLPLSGTGAQPVVQLSATTINFPDQATNTPSTAQVIAVTNKGTVPLTIRSFSFNGTNASDFSTATAPTTLQPNASLNVGVVFNPPAIGSRTANLQINDNASDTPQTVALTGKGVGVPVFHVDSASLDFGQQQDLQQSGAKTLTISNSGTGDLVISTMTISGNNPSDFTYGIVGGGGTGFGDFPETIAPGANMVVNVYFTPSQGGLRQAVLAIADNAAGHPHQMPVSGTGIATPPTANLSTTSLTFAAQPVNTTSAGQTITITNTGQTDLSVTSVSIGGANASEFQVTPTGPFTVTKGGGTTTLTVTFTPTALNGRSAALSIADNAATPPSPQTVAVSGTGRGQGQISLPPLSVGANLETLATGSLDVAPTSALTVTITSSDPSKVLLVPVSTDPNGATQGVAQISGVVPAGQGRLGFGFPGFWVQALASSGTAQVTISAPGYANGTATVTFTPSGFVLNSPNGTGANFTSILGADATLSVSPVQLDNSGNILSTGQVLRGGLTANVTVSSGTPATGTILGNPAVVPSGKGSSSAVNFHPVAGGTSQLSIAQPAGYSAPSTGTRLTVTVSQPAISLNPITIGFNLQGLGVGQLNLAPTSTLAVTITSSDPSRVLLSTNQAAVGTGSIGLSVAAGSTQLPLFYVQALGSSGVVTLTASANGYSNATGNVALGNSAFLLSGPNGMANFNTTTISPATGLTVAVWQLDSSSRPLLQGILRPGASASVAVSSGTPNTGTISGSPALFAAGDTINNSLSFQPAQNCTTPCTTLLSVTQPSGFASPASGGQLTVTVNQASLSLRTTEPTIGGNLEVPASGALDAPAPSNLPVTITSNNANVLLSAAPGLPGSQSIVVTVPTGSGVNSIGFPTYYVQALNNVGTAQLIATAPGFSPGSMTVTLAPAGFVVSGANGVGANFGTLLGNGTANLTVNAAVLDPATLAPSQIFQQVRGGIAPAVTVSSDNPAATVTGSPVQVSGGNSGANVTLQLQATGVANITVTTPAGFTTPSSGTQLSVTIN